MLAILVLPDITAEISCSGDAGDLAVLCFSFVARGDRGSDVVPPLSEAAENRLALGVTELFGVVVVRTLRRGLPRVSYANVRV